MEATAKLQFKVGVFLVIGIAIAMISIFMIGGDKTIFTGRMRFNARFQHVQGLAQGSVVSLSGITVGNIERIDFLPEENTVNVVMTVDKRFASRFNRGSRVEIRTQGALGDKFIFVTPGDPREPALDEGSLIETGKASDLLSVFAERGQETEKVFDIIDELHKMTRTINGSGRLEKIMADMESAGTDLKVTTGEARRFSEGLAATDPRKLKTSIDGLARIVTKIDRGEGTLGALINDPSLHDRLKAILGGSSRPQHIKSMLRTSIEMSDGK